MAQSWGMATGAQATAKPCSNNTILVAGSTGDWATDAVIKESASIETYSDGYKCTISVHGAVVTTASDVYKPSI